MQAGLEQKCIVMYVELMFRFGSCDLFSNVMVGRILHALLHKMLLCLLQGQLFRNIMGKYFQDCMASLIDAWYLDMDDYIIDQILQTEHLLVVWYIFN